MKNIFKMALVLRIFDYLTMRPLNNLRIVLPEGYKFIPKGDGYFAVLGSEKPDFMTISMSGYQDCMLEKEQMTDEMIIWLKPEKNSYSKTILCEKVPENTVFAYKSDELRLLVNKAEEQNEITLFTERMIVLEGRKILLEYGKKQDIVEVFSQNKEKLVISKTENAYPKIKTQIYVLFEGEKGADSQFFIQVPSDDDFKVIYT